MFGSDLQGAGSESSTFSGSASEGTSLKAECPAELAYICEMSHGPIHHLCQAISMHGRFVAICICFYHECTLYTYRLLLFLVT
jgi:hypothetical protein